MSDSLHIGTRGSELALAQTRLVQEALASHSIFSEITIIRTAGDNRLDLPLNAVNQAEEVQDKGIFIAALEEALLNGEIDCAVHSLKDMPGLLDGHFEIAAILPREAINDTLVIKNGAHMEAPVIGTGSVRRQRLTDCYWSGRAHTQPIRGNVLTRLNHLIQTAEMDATILARAGLNRLGYTGSVLNVNGVTLHLVDMPEDSFMPALGQGAIAVEIRKGDARARQLLSPLNHQATALCTRTERAFLALLGADCSLPVGGYAICQGSAILFRAVYFTPQGIPIRITQRGFVNKPEDVAQAAFDQLQQHLQD